MNKFIKTLLHGFWKDLPPFRLVLGLCPALAVTSTAENGMGMGLAATFVLVFSNVLISLLRRQFPIRCASPAISWSLPRWSLSLR